MTFLIASAYAIVIVSILATVLRTRGMLMNPAVVFLLVQIVLLLGTVPLTDPDNAADRFYLTILLVAIVFYCLGIAFAQLYKPMSRKRVTNWCRARVSIADAGPRVDVVLYSIVLISVIVCIWYYRAVGYNVFLMSLRSIASGEMRSADDMATLRLDAYSSGEYLAPGYVNQFKNVLLPSILAYFATRYYFDRRRASWLIALALSPLTLIFLLGTGQRSPLVITAFAVALFVFYASPKKSGRRVSYALLVVAAGLYFTSTFILQRSAGTLSNEQDAVHLLADGVDRVVNGNQIAGVMGFRYIYDIPVVWGADWFGKVLRMFPVADKRVPTIDNEVHGYAFGSMRGTAPLTIWGSGWYNFGWFGVTAFPFVLGFVYQSTFRRMISGPKTLFRLLVYVYVAVILGSWAPGGPDYLLNNGLGAIALLSLLVRGVPSEAPVRPKPWDIALPVRRRKGMVWGHG